MPNAFIDTDEWRDTPRRHRYVHGGFEGTETRFSFYFPPVEEYQGRFVQYLEGGAGGHDNLISLGYDGKGMKWFFDLSFDELGGYMVESNQGHFPGEGLGFDDDYELFGASADSAEFAKELAAEMYGEGPHHGYIWGVSGGGARSGHCLENRPDIWQGGAPHAGIGQDTQWSPWGLTWLLARDKFAAIIDAAEPGGSGNPFDGLTHAQREALAEMYRRGYPRGAENQLAPFTPWAFPMYATKDFDPGYFDDFWNVPGYLGHDDPQILSSVLIDERHTVSRLVKASDITNVMAQMAMRLATAGASGTEPTWGIQIDTDDHERLFMAKVTVLTGEAAGRELLISGTEDDVLSPFSERTPEMFEGIAVGDEVRVDNRDFVAWCYYHWYQIEDPTVDGIDREFEPWLVDGNAVYPQRGSRPVSAAAPSRYKRTLSNKMIYVQPTLDAQVWPTTISRYAQGIRTNLGDAADDHFRLWFCENAPHGTPEFLGPALTSEKDPGVWTSRLVNYDGVTAQALRAVVRWTEDGVAPVYYHGYDLSRDNGLKLPGTAAERGGVQPVVTAQANGAARAEVKVGEPVNFLGSAEQPAGQGTIVRAEWDFDGRGAFERHEVDGTASTVDVKAEHAYSEPGTYFASFRVGAYHDGVATGPTIDNLARVRVVVTG
ncbi:MAG TPA: hypothetical protein VFZ17_06095 [Acidimicrobiia bacterium]|nr:hypothetical protein [Acidimicrobiia bacterium]